MRLLLHLGAQRRNAKMPPDECGAAANAVHVLNCVEFVKRVDRRVEHVLRVMARRDAAPARVGDLAREVNLSESHLTRLFRAETGKAPSRYDRDARLERARDLIVNSFKSIKEVMAAVGWNDPSHFCRDFKQKFGVSPRALRSAIRG